MDIQTDPSDSPDELKKAINNIGTRKNVRSLVILSCDANGFTPDNLDHILKDSPVPLFGGIFPAILYGKKKMEKGSIVLGMHRESELIHIHGLSDSKADYEDMLDKLIPEIGAMKTMLVFVDGFAKRISAFIDSLFNTFGLEINYIGGGAGDADSSDMEQKPCLFTNEGLVQDSAILALLDLESGVGVSHGWEHMDGPFWVTETDGNIVKTIDWRPAFEVYKEVVEKYSGKVITEQNFFEIAKAYPFGIVRLGTEWIVRDPYKVGENNSLVCFGEIPERSFIHILEGKESSLIKAAGDARDFSREAFKSQGDSGINLFIDCISRVLFLGEAFSKELEAVYDENRELIGACTIGEIANCGKGYLEFYNKTSVVAILEEI